MSNSNDQDGYGVYEIELFPTFAAVFCVEVLSTGALCKPFTIEIGRSGIVG
jgi:hypothetical protein